MTERTIAENFPPGEFIREELEARQWSQIELAEIIGRSPNVVSELIAGKRSVTAEIARALGEAFGTSAQYWMNLESGYQLYKLRRSRGEDEAISRRAKLYQIAPIKEMVKRHWIESSENVEVLEKRILKFFEIETLAEEPVFPHAARKGTPSPTISSAQLTWLFRAKQLARAVHAAPFSERSFQAGLTKLKALVASTEAVRRVPRILADAGIRFLVVEHLPQTRIDGVTFWLDSKSPVVVLSLRYDRVDWFWHTLLHELGHVKRRDGLEHTLILDTDLVGDEAQPFDKKSDAEKQADLFASEFLVKQSDLQNFILRVRPLYGRQKIIGFANRIGVHPGIVVGQLQHRREIPWSSFRNMLDKVWDILTPSTLTDGWGQSVQIDR